MNTTYAMDTTIKAVNTVLQVKYRSYNKELTEAEKYEIGVRVIQSIVEKLRREEVNILLADTLYHLIRVNKSIINN